MPLSRVNCLFAGLISLALPAIGHAQATLTRFTLGGNTITSRGTGVSTDGTVASGFASNPQFFTASHAMRWRSGMGMQDLGLVSGQAVFDITKAWGISGDGGTVVGERYGTNAGGYPPVAFRWTEAGGFELLGTMAGGVRTIATSANEDGSIVTGTGDSSFGVNRSFRWIAGSGFQDLGTMTGGTSAYAARINLDGSVI